MAFSSGTFTLVSGNPVVTGTTISSTTHNNTMSDIADNGLTLCMLKDGTQTLTANIPFGNFRLTGLGAATARTDAAQAAQVQNFAFNILSTVAGTNTITGAVTPALTAYTNGQLFLFQPVNTNTGQATLNIDSVGAQPIFWNGATATASMLRVGRSIIVEYISTSSATGLHIVGYTGFIPAAMITARGDLYCGATANDVTILARGADDTVLVATASATAGLAWKSSINLAAIDISGTASSSVINVNTLDIRSSASATFIVVNTINANILNVSFSASASVMRSNTLDVSASASVSALNATLATIGILNVTATASVSALNATNLDVSTTASISRLLVGGGIMILGDTSANTQMTTGITINQGAADNEILTLKSTDVSHAMTGITEADTFALSRKVNAATGGLRLTGFSSGGVGLWLQSQASTTDNTKSTSGAAGLILEAGLNSGATASVYGGSANLMVLRDHTTTRFIWDASGVMYSIGSSFTDQIGNGLWFINDSANADMTTGLTINQGAADNDILALKSSDVAHGITDFAETDSYFQILKQAGADGGALIRGFSEATIAVQIGAFSSAVTSLKSTSATGPIMLTALLKASASATALGGTSNLLVVRDNTLTRFIFAANGEFFADVGSTTYDTYNDIELLDAYEMEMARRKGTLIKTGFVDWLAKNRDILQREKIVNFYDDGPRAFVNFSRLAMLHTGAIRQNSRKVDEVMSTLMQELNERDKRIEALENRLLYIEHKSDNDEE